MTLNLSTIHKMFTISLLVLTSMIMFDCSDSGNRGISGKRIIGKVAGRDSAYRPVRRK